jgi:hypothetical protein
MLSDNTSGTDNDLLSVFFTPAGQAVLSQLAQQQPSAFSSPLSSSSLQFAEQNHSSPLLQFLQLNAMQSNTGGLGLGPTRTLSQQSSTTTEPSHYQVSPMLRSSLPEQRHGNLCQKQHQQLSERQEFLLFIKMLLHYLQVSGNPRLKMRVKAIVAECTSRNRRREPDYVNLPQVVEARLRGIVGELYWTQAKDSVNEYIKRKGLQRSTMKNHPITAM